ncbi:EAL domain-containing protein [Roseospirillum parvum]|uniref:PAS domain S-box-containing protein/diguanylate cyclase (GGDEF) domain-containing protein n=1 Tax=Roseospirillum parvum TaxID=83401 RepID=A0A1G7Z825_9PROT|nr:EAL domain-containing protein [Roseospirillum parvum]SDH04901.1 PAS domain S-box-containing protein/diguanylate cyclase (GGDEF) domain-containing protein [Roseospirillum parvum]
MTTAVPPRPSGAEAPTPEAIGEILRTAFAAVAEGVVVLDPEGNFVVFNPGAESLFGHRGPSVIGQSVDLILPDHTGGIHLFAGGDPAAGPIKAGRRFVPCLRRDGSTFTAELHLSTAPMGNQRLLIAAVRDAVVFSSARDMCDDAEERLSSLTATMPGIVFQRVMQVDGTIYYPFFSAAVRDLIGYDPDEMPINQEGYPDAIHWADRQDYLAAIRRSARHMVPMQEEFRVITRHGEVLWLRGTSRPARMANGDILWDGVLIDVTDKVRAEQWLEMVMDHAADCIITIGEDGTIESVNAALVEAFGYPAEELIGANIAMLLPEEMDGPPDQALRRFLAAPGLAPDQGVPHHDALELRGQRRDGRTFALEMALSEVLTEGKRLFIGILRDITGRKATEQALHESQQRLGNIANNIPGVVFQRYQRRDGRAGFNYLSDGCGAVLGGTAEEHLADGKLFLEALHPEDRATFIGSAKASMASLESLEEDFRVVHRDNGQISWLRVLAVPRRLDDETVIWDGVALDVTDRKKAEEHIRFLAFFDTVTGLGNRARFLERFETARHNAEQTRTWIAVLSLGLDRFGIVNASMGHSTGDQVLAAAARRIQGCLGAEDLLCRAGGDRFLVMLTGISALDDIYDTVEVIQHGFLAPITVERHEFDLTASLGAAVYPRDGATAEVLIQHADAALQRAKSGGPGTFQLFTEEMGARAARTLTMQNRLRRGLDNREFLAFYQPQIDLRDGRVVGMEALVRWQSPDEGLVNPSEFIPVAEEYGLIDAICEQVLFDACHWNKRWQDLGLAHVPVAVNISGRQFHNAAALMASVRDALGQSGLAPGFLELELTESSAMSDPENAINVVRMLADLGVSCAIDDFGTGYSSLSVLKRFPLSKLKIDRSFVMEVTTDPNDAAIVCAIIAMANALNLNVVAEGVETQEHLDFMHGVGCNNIQGFLISRPLPPEEMELFFSKARAQPTTASKVAAGGSGLGG